MCGGPCTPGHWVLYLYLLGPAAFSVNFVLSLDISHRWALSLALFLFHYSQTDTFTQTRWNSISMSIIRETVHVRDPEQWTSTMLVLVLTRVKAFRSARTGIIYALNLYPWKNEIAVSFAWILIGLQYLYFSLSLLLSCLLLFTQLLHAFAQIVLDCINKKCHGVADNTEVRYKRLKSAIKKFKKHKAVPICRQSAGNGNAGTAESLTVHGQGCESLVRFFLSKRAAKRWILYVDGFFI